MKIDLMLNSLIGGGAERVMATLSNGLAREHEIRLITFNEAEAYTLVDEVKRVKLHQGSLKNHTLRSIKNLYQFYRTKTNRPDVLIAFMPANNLIAIIVSKLLGIKVIVSEHTNHTAIVNRKTKYIQKYFYRYADAITVLTSFDLPYFRKYGARVTVMPNPLNLPNSVKKFSERKQNILAVGALDRYKNKGFDSLLHIISVVLKKHKDWTLTIAGSGDDGLQVLKDLTEQLKLEGQIIFPGFCNNMQDLMQNSQIFVLPSKYEGLPMGLMEALSNGMACVAYDCPSGPSELIEHNVNGLLIANQDTQAMQRSVLRVIEDYDLRERLAYNAPASMQRYDLAHIIDQWERLINFVVTNNGANRNAIV